MNDYTHCTKLGLKECPACVSGHYISYCFINQYSNMIRQSGIIEALNIAFKCNEVNYITAAVDEHHPEYKDRLDKMLLLM